MQAVFVKGLIIGFVIAVPIGPTGLLCITRGLYGGFGYGLLSWLGVATGDALAGGIAAFGTTVVSNFFSSSMRGCTFLSDYYFVISASRFLLLGPPSLLPSLEK